ncbi:MAG: hypothetical protein ACR2L2_12115 [Acidobacteriota bacterium]
MLADNAMVALALLVAESAPAQKELRDTLLPKLISGEVCTSFFHLKPSLADQWPWKILGCLRVKHFHPATLAGGVPPNIGD